MMTNTHDKLREAVARALFDYDYAWTSRKQKPVLDKWWEQWGSNKDGPWFEQADAAIATMFERLRSPSEGVSEAGWDAYHDGHHVNYIWQAMLDKFQQENEDGQ